MAQVFTVVWHKWLRRPYRLRVVTDEGNMHGTPVLLLHGLASEGEAWRPLIDQIDHKRYRVIVLDLLGFGSSPHPSHLLYDVRDHARAVAYTLQKLGLPDKKSTLEGAFSRGDRKLQGCIVIGHSMGCLVATHLAAQYSGLVRHLILYEPPLYADDPVYRSHRKRAARYMAFYEYIASHPELLMLQHRRLYRIAQKLSGLVLHPESWLAFERSLRNTIMRQMAFKELHSTRISTDIVHGRLDFVVVRTEVKKMFAANPHITLHMVTAFHGITRRAAEYLNSLLEVVGGVPRPSNSESDHTISR